MPMPQRHQRHDRTKQTISACLPAYLVDMLDERAKADERSRSAMLAILLKRLFEREEAACKRATPCQ